MPADRAISDLVIYRNEPLMRLITRSKFASPISLGVAFLVIVSLPLTVWAVWSQPDPGDGHAFVTFLESVSWSLSVIYLLPFIVALTLRYYQAIPELFEYLFTRLQHRENHDIAIFRSMLEKNFNVWWVPIVLFSLTLALNLVYFDQTLNEDKVRWLNAGTLLQTQFNSQHGFTPVGLYAQIIQIVMIYWILMLIWKGFVFAWTLHYFFRAWHDDIHIDPLHPDGCCGLKRIGNVASILNLILFLIGIYLSLRVIDKVLIQQTSHMADIGGPLMWGGYVIIAPLLFFLPLGAAHNKMLEVKQNFIYPISQKCEDVFRRLDQLQMDEKGHETISSLEEMERLRHELERDIPVWPFDFRSIQAFFGTIVVPLLPVILPYVIGFIVGNPGAE